jgi:Ca-activated chloride channel homolog
MFRRLLLLFLFAGSLSAQKPDLPTPKPVPAQTKSVPKPSQPAPPPQSDAQNKIRINSELVVLPVTVKDAWGELVPDLQPSEFRIFDDGIEQSLDIFTVEAFPLSLVVLIDDDLKRKDAAQMTPSLRAITAGISVYDEAMICRYDLSFHPGDGFSSDLDTLWAALKDVQTRSAPSTTGPVPFMGSPSDHALGVGEPAPRGPINAGSRPTKALDDAVFAATELLHDRGPVRRKMILIVSDGSNAPALNDHTYEEVRDALLHNNISVYSLAVGSSLMTHKYSRLIDYANDTGGDIYYATTSAAMERLYSRITEEARHEYTLAYVPRGINRNIDYHKLEVRVARDGVTVKTRLGYYAGPAPVSPPSAPGPADPR